jgi:DNA-binding transcriptional ArsR family regulator
MSRLHPSGALAANVRRASQLLKAMANDRRLIVLMHLADGEKSVGQLERLVGLSQSALSQHLARLRREKVVATRREKQTIYYSLANGEASAVMAALQDAYRAADAPVRDSAVRDAAD